MFDRLTDRARKVMSFTRQEAMKFNHEYIGTEHILLGLLREESGIAGEVLRSFGATLERVQTEIGRIVKAGSSMVTMFQLPFTVRAKKALQFSLEEADLLSRNYVGTEHLLLGLLRENEGIAAQVFVMLDVKTEDVRSEVLRFLGVPEDS